MIHNVAITSAALFAVLASAAATIDKRIVGGVAAKEGEFRYIVAIYDEKGDRFCAGTLLNERSVVTAAHCVDKAHHVKAGTLNHKACGVTVKVASGKKHPNYKSNALHDIGMLKLVSAIQESDRIVFAKPSPKGPIPLASSTAIVAGCKGPDNPIRRDS
ncbi:Peptidase cysteine/serine, trypsin-like protein [Metarhizium album ARSEF 1941]|uniref:Peptidase cysteine/serine, trypsin-like protein n=1 Tax=Metarhizium album (strain ARSEF 1941) TaxID=1081103 RepID=A0A0B2X4J1_METAS|nr:Peptidase cysteine/serine, trypsin-like protein [Metarhizium album ARSEF 1941]KHO00221.1 Peptidase cysteine/serine, trypsin-like protein [Metarhizium album ARSEF 1941]